MNDKLMERQLLLEQAMQRVGMAAYWKHVDGAVQSEMEAATPYGETMVREVIDPIAARVTAFVKECGPRRGAKPKAYRYLKDADPHVVAYLTAKIVFNHLSTMPVLLTATAMEVGHAIEDEARFKLFEAECKPLWRKVKRDLDKRTSSRPWQRTVLIHSMGKAQIAWEPWDPKQLLHLGTRMLGFFLKENDWVKAVTTSAGKKKAKTVLEVTAMGEEFAHSKNMLHEMFSPRLLPMLVKPLPWIGSKDGGYYTLMRDVEFVKTRNDKYLEELDGLSDQLGDVYAAVNAVQDVAWSINTPVMQTLSHVFFNNLPLGKLPSMEKLEAPTKPLDIDTNLEARRLWRIAAAKVHLYNTQRSSKAFQVGQAINVATQFEPEAAIYLPHSLDFRGRLYAMGPLSPQGPDYVKALLQFAKGKPINDPVALGRLMTHGANCYGYDKATIDDRVQWVSDNEDDILRCAADPLSHKLWVDADEPWQFLAFCFDYAAFQEHGWGYVSHLPCTQDGSCNGLQHFSAMLRDEVGGAAVNLVPSDIPADIYQTVIDKVKVVLREAHWDDVAEMGARKNVYSQGKLAREWLRLCPDRKLAKRPVMTLPYGATRHSCREYVEAWLLEFHPDHPFTGEGELFVATLFMGRLIWESIETTVIAAKEAMEWLRKVARIASADGVPVNWVTPDGFPVCQAYNDTKAQRVKTMLGDTTVFQTLVTHTTKIDAARQTSGISPNFVHSLDATVLRRYVLLARDNGIESMGLVHDSFGTVAADAEMSAMCQRIAFVETYESCDVLKAFRRDLCAGMTPKNAAKVMALPLPKWGSLVLRLILKHTYFTI